jgi:hypothetical protein
LSSKSSVTNFLEELETQLTFRIENSEDLLPSKSREFTRFMLDLLEEAAETDDASPCEFKQHRMKLDGFALPDKEDYLDLFVTMYFDSLEPKAVPPEQIRTAFRQVTTFFEECLSEYYRRVSATTPIHKVAKDIFEARHRLTRVRFFCLTNGLSSTEKTEEKVEGRTYSYFLWDVQRTLRSVMSEQRQEPIEVDFLSEFGMTLPCIPITGTGPDYDVCLTVIPGDLLYKLYKEYGARLLERNVRSYLQARGKVNKGIHQTIRDCPERFLAYNNGLSATADSVQYAENSDKPGSEWRIRKVTNLQIVNGGQTTASIYHAYRKESEKIAQISVPVKLSIVQPHLLDEIVPLISRYSNSQNKVSDADFYANDTFHVAVQKLASQIWTQSAGKQSKWYYERARGSYLQEKTRRKSEFEKEFPKEQVFDKTELAKYLMAYEGSPFVVSLGAEKCFREFTKRLIDEPRNVDEKFFKEVVARAILFRAATKLVKQQKYGGYENHIVAYSIAYLSEYASSKKRAIDLQKIWREQKISPILEQAIVETSKIVQAATSEVEQGKNVYEWFKKASTWELIKAKIISVSDQFRSELISP